MCVLPQRSHFNWLLTQLISPPQPDLCVWSIGYWPHPHFGQVYLDLLIVCPAQLLRELIIACTQCQGQ